MNRQPTGKDSCLNRSDAVRVSKGASNQAAGSQAGARNGRHAAGRRDRCAALRLAGGPVQLRAQAPTDLSHHLVGDRRRIQGAGEPHKRVLQLEAPLLEGVVLLGS